MKKTFILCSALALGLVLVGCANVKDDVYDMDLSNEDLVIEEDEAIEETLADENVPAETLE